MQPVASGVGDPTKLVDDCLCMSFSTDWKYINARVHLGFGTCWYNRKYINVREFESSAEGYIKGFRSTVQWRIWVRSKHLGRAYIHQGWSLMSLHFRKQCLGHKDLRVYVNIDHLNALLNRHIWKLTQLAYANIIDQDTYISFNFFEFVFQGRDCNFTWKCSKIKN